MDILMLVILLLVVVNLHVLYRELGRTLKTIDLRLQGLHARLGSDGAGGVKLPPALADRVSTLASTGKEIEAVHEIMEAFCV